MKTVIKIVLWTVGIVFAAILAVILSLPWWICPLIRGCVNAVAPQVVQTTFSLGEFDIGFRAATLHVGEVQLGNPMGYKPEDAFRLGALDIALDQEGTTNNIVHFKSISLRDIYASYSSVQGTNNFSRLLANVEESVGFDEEEPAVRQESGKSTKVAMDEVSVSDMRVIVDRLEIKGIKLQVGPVPVALPVQIVLENIGKKTGGVSWDELWVEVLGAVKKSGGDLGGALKSLGIKGIDLGKDGIKLGKDGVQLGKDGVQIGKDGLQKLSDSMKGLDAEKAKGAMKDAERQFKDVGNSLKSLFK